MSDKTKLVVRESMEWVVSILLAIAIAFVLREYVFSLVEVRGESMQNTLQNKDRLFVARLFYEPKYGDITVFEPPNSDEYYIKRVIAVGGQTVDIDFDKSIVYVDGKALNEPYIKEELMHKSNQQDLPLPVTVPEGQVFVLGDNRNNSRDSRFSDVGMIEKKKLLGKAVLRVWPFKDFGGLYKGSGLNN